MAEVDDNLRAWWAVKTMSERMGADLSKELRRGTISVEEISEIVLKCQDCKEAGHCKSVLRSQAPIGEDIKAGCPNRDTFEAYARVKEMIEG